jgi:histidine ammonia-lyase
MMPFFLDGQTLSAEQVCTVSHGAKIRLADSARSAMVANHQEWVDLGSPDVLAGKEAWLLGSDEKSLAPSDERLRAFVESHCAGVGEDLPDAWVRALMLCRANVLAVARSGCRPESVEILIEMLNAGIHPLVPRLGSVGAAGDLAPLAHIARVVFRLGGRARRDGAVYSAADAMQGLPAFTPTSKEALSFINGASLSVALAAIACVRAEKLLKSSEHVLAMTMEAVLAQKGCIQESALEARGQKGGVQVAKTLSTLLNDSVLVNSDRRPDAFSIRCAPSVLGAARDTLDHVSQVIHRELNGACDNPLIIDGALVEAGNFHGAPVGLVMDFLKVALTQVGTLTERRIFRMTHGDLSGKLPSFLVEDNGTHSGFMLAQYTAASLASECKGLAMPASVDSIPTGQHHEDHVSMAPIAARACLRILNALSEIISIEAICAAQALDFRMEGATFSANGEKQIGKPNRPAQAVKKAHSAVRNVSERWTSDRVMHLELQACSAMVRGGELLEVPSPW